MVLSFRLGSGLIETFDVSCFFWFFFFLKTCSPSSFVEYFNYGFLCSLPQSWQRGGGGGGRREVTLSKSVEIQGINYGKWRNMGIWLFLWVRNILICRCQPAAPPRTPVPFYLLQAHIKSSPKRGKQPPVGPFPSPTSVTIVTGATTVLSATISSQATTFFIFLFFF